MKRLTLTLALAAFFLGAKERQMVRSASRKEELEKFLKDTN